MQDFLNPLLDLRHVVLLVERLLPQFAERLLSPPSLYRDGAHQPVKGDLLAPLVHLLLLSPGVLLAHVFVVVVHALGPAPPLTHDVRLGERLVLDRDVKNILEFKLRSFYNAQ